MSAFNARADNAGSEPALGDFVAYNYSGQIATGWIVGVGRSKYSPLYRIHQVAPNEGHISRVRGGPKCLLVLQTKDGNDVPHRPA